MSEKTNIPQIRFKGFNDVWEQCKFGEIMEEVTDYVAAGSFADLAENVKYLSTPDYAQLVRTTDLKANFTNNDFIYVNEHAFNFLWRVNLNKECIIMPNIGNCGEIYFINPNKLPYKHNVLGPNAIFVRSTTNNNKFLSYNFQTETFQKKLKLIISPNGQTKFNKTELKTILTFKAELAEQNKLGDLFEQIDNLITLHQRKHEKYTNIKKALLEKIFPQNGEKIPQIRFKGFTEAWEQCKLNDLGVSTSGTSIESEFSDEGVYNVISIGSYSEDSIYNDQGIKAIHSSKTENRVLDEGDLTMILNDKTQAGRILGRVLLIEKSSKYVYNQRTQRIQPYKNKFSSEFLYHLLNAPLVRNKIIKQSQGNTQIYVNWSAIKETEYFVPNLVEQEKLGQMFSKINDLITLHQRECEKLKNIKKSLLEKMFV